MRELWRELAPFVRLLHPYRLRMTLGTILGLTAVAAAAGLLGRIQLHVPFSFRFQR